MRILDLFTGLTLLAAAGAAATTPVGEPSTCSTIPAKERVDCMTLNRTQSWCESKGCCWDGDAVEGVPSCFYPSAQTQNITTVHVVQACHLDVGYSDLSVGVVNEYFDTYFPAAKANAEVLNALGNPGNAGLRFMTQSFLVSLYLDCPPGMGLHCPNETALAAFNESVANGYITWHAYPFNAETSTSNSDGFAHGVQMTHALDAAYGLAPKATLSQRDVPGMSKAVLPILAAHGVKAVSVGVNGASTPPDDPRVFRWSDPVSGVTLPAMWHPLGYGGDSRGQDAVIVPGHDHALILSWEGDNAGPPSVGTVLENWISLALQFPGAEIVPSTFDNFTSTLYSSDPGASSPFIPPVNALPEITRDLAESWVFGPPSDPWKSASMRAAFRWRSECIRASDDDECKVGPGVSTLLEAPAATATSGANAAPSPIPRSWTPFTSLGNFSRLLLKSSEHTWGADTKRHLDWATWTNQQLAAKLTAPVSEGYAFMNYSWVEQRLWGVDYPLQALSMVYDPDTGGRAPSTQQMHRLAEVISEEIDGFRGTPDVGDGVPQQSVRGKDGQSWGLLWSTEEASRNTEGSVVTLPVPSSAGVTIGIDAGSGAIVGLQAAGGRSWADASHPVAFFEYRSYSPNDTTAFMSTYLDVAPPLPTWAEYDYGKPNASIAGATHVDIGTSLEHVYTSTSTTSFTALLNMTINTPPGFADGQLHEEFGAPAQVWMEISVPLIAASDLTRINTTFYIVDKTMTRLPESGLLRFTPLPTDADLVWGVQKLGQWIGAGDVQSGASQALHGMDPEGGFAAQVGSGGPSTSAPDLPVLTTSGGVPTFSTTNTGGESLVIVSRDAAVVCMGKPTGYPVPVLSSPDTAEYGAAALLWNNLWDTNYPQWIPFGPADASVGYRFQLLLTPPPQQ